MGDVPSRWRGLCMQGLGFKKSSCNKTLIDARYYGDQPGSAAPNASLVRVALSTGSPRDDVGHGTHCASMVAGAIVEGADFYGLARCAAKGDAPAARVASYKVCTEDENGCSGSALLKAIDDTVSDGVDVISISIGETATNIAPDLLTDPVALGAFHTHQRGVLVVCSAGNDGPDQSTVVNSAPWILTVAASTIDRAFHSSIVLGNRKVFKGVAINFSNQSLDRERYPLVFGAQAATRSTVVCEASNCYPGSLRKRKVAGKILVCIGTDSRITRRIKKLGAEDSGARGLVVIDDKAMEAPIDTASFPFSQVGADAGAQILRYINSTKNPTAVILPTKDVKLFKPAPVVASFSARGPATLTEAILKPDLMAPGVSILAEMPPMNILHQVRHFHGLPARRRRRRLPQVGPPGLVPINHQISSHEHSPQGLPQLPLVPGLQGQAHPQGHRRRPVHLPAWRTLAGPHSEERQLPVHLGATARGREGVRSVTPCLHSRTLARFQ